MRNKLKFLATLLILFSLVFNVSAAPTNPYTVFGVASVNGVIAPGMTVKLTNTNTGDFETTITNQVGVFGFHLDTFPNAYAPGHNLKLIYCISDTRCNQREIELTVTNGAVLQKNIFASASGVGGGVPHLVWGKIFLDGSEITIGTISLKNLDSENKETVTLEITTDGFQFNLGNLQDGYSTGDMIQITYDGNIVKEFMVSGDNSNFNINLHSPIQSAPSQGGSGGGGGSKTTPTTEIVPKLVNNGRDIFDIGQTILQGTENAKFSLNIKGITHSITFLNIETNFIELLIESTPINLKLNIGESKHVDLEQDGSEDLKFTLNAITDGQADVTVEPIFIEIIEGPQGDEPDKPKDPVPSQPDEKEGSLIGRLVLALIIVAAIAFGIRYYLKKDKGGE